MPPKVRLIIWCTLHNILPTNLNLSKRIAGFPSSCQLCSEAMDDDYHALFGYVVSLAVWDLVEVPSPWQNYDVLCFKELLQCCWNLETAQVMLSL